MSSSKEPQDPGGRIWPSRIDASLIVAGAAAPGEIRTAGDDVFWSETRPAEGGRVQIVRSTPDGSRFDLLPVGASARSRVHEYGGGAWDVAGTTLVYVDDSADGRVIRRDVHHATATGAGPGDDDTAMGAGPGDDDTVTGAGPGDDDTVTGAGPGDDATAMGAGPGDDDTATGAGPGDDDTATGATSGDDATQISPEPRAGEDPRAVRYADLHLDLTGGSGGQIIAVRERHEPGGTVHNDVVAMPLTGQAAADPDQVRVLATGADFYASPSLDPTGDRLVVVRWQLPDMPWDATEVVVIEVSSGAETVVAGGPGESVVEPQWAHDGTLTYLSDRTGWWNPYRWDPTDGSTTPLARIDAEIGGPLWVFGNRSLAWLPDGRFVCCVTAGGTDALAVGRGDGTAPVRLDVPFTHIPQVVAAPDGGVVVVAGTPTAESTPYRVDLTEPDPGAARVPAVSVSALRPFRDLGLGNEPTAWLSTPEPLTVTHDDGAECHALLYPPRNPTVPAADVSRPAPLLVMIHGGPTSAARAQLNLVIQFWTSRGFLVADVNYRGSSGYGRPYREALRSNWGVVDVADCVAVAQHLAATGRADPDRLGIRGGSAGGFTTLAALAFHDTFTAGASSYGIADLAVLAADTHKFESRYLDSLVGPWPEAADRYRERSPLFHLDRLDRPVAIFQGDQDAVVPPNQADQIVDALRSRGLPHAVVHFADEGHGFRNAPNIVRALEGELWFFARAFDLELDAPIEPLPGAGLA